MGSILMIPLLHAFARRLIQPNYIKPVPNKNTALLIVNENPPP